MPSERIARPYLEKFIGFYTTDGYVCYKVFDTTDEELARAETRPPEGIKKQKLEGRERFVARLKTGSTADLMKSIEDRLADYALSYDAGCGELLKKALR